MKKIKAMKIELTLLFSEPLTPTPANVRTILTHVADALAHQVMNGQGITPDTESAVTDRIEVKYGQETVVWTHGKQS